MFDTSLLQNPSLLLLLSPAVLAYLIEMDRIPNLNSFYIVRDGGSTRRSNNLDDRTSAMEVKSVLVSTLITAVVVLDTELSPLQPRRQTVLPPSPPICPTRASSWPMRQPQPTTMIDENSDAESPVDGVCRDLIVLIITGTFDSDVVMAVVAEGIFVFLHILDYSSSSFLRNLFITWLRVSCMA
ncbi:hypothetical protein FRB94_008780 [Tulasnella sp. JGI-2019a]|nr:hypothetical protein FRB94_008780 [Tulasnella sp. JGI-2019a]